MMFLPCFYTDVVGIKAGAMGVLFLVVRLFDVCYDPLVGNIADNTRGKYGRCRPYLLYLAIPYGLSCYLVFLTPDFSASGKLIYAHAAYFFLILMYASTVVPYMGLLTAISSDPAERLADVCSEKARRATLFCGRLSKKCRRNASSRSLLSVIEIVKNTDDSYYLLYFGKSCPKYPDTAKSWSSIIPIHHGFVLLLPDRQLNP